MVNKNTNRRLKMNYNIRERDYKEFKMNNKLLKNLYRLQYNRYVLEKKFWRENMSKQQKNIINYIVICINEFAKQFKMTSKEAYLYLRNFKGIEFLKENYEAEHTVGLDDAIDDLKQVCINNGGDIK